DQGACVGEMRLILGGVWLVAGPQAVLPMQRQKLAQERGAQRLRDRGQVFFQARSLPRYAGRLEAITDLLNQPDVGRGQEEQQIAHGASSSLHRMRMASSFRATVRLEQASCSAISSLP